MDHVTIAPALPPRWFRPGRRHIGWPESLFDPVKHLPSGGMLDSAVV